MLTLIAAESDIILSDLIIPQKSPIALHVTRLNRKLPVVRFSIQLVNCLVTVFTNPAALGS